MLDIFSLLICKYIAQNVGLHGCELGTAPRSGAVHVQVESADATPTPPLADLHHRRRSLIMARRPWLWSALIALLVSTISVLADEPEVKVNHFHNAPARFFYFEDTEVRVRAYESLRLN
jgi:hypothetical protein